MRKTLTPLLLCVACGGADSDQSERFTRTDSAGVELVHNGPEGALGPERLHLAEDLRLGAADGPEILQFFRIGQVRVDTAGLIYVPDNGSGELRIFSRDGTFLRKMGRRGSGPGEFQQISNVIIHGNDVVVVDGGLRRTTSFKTGGSVADTWPIQRGALRISPLARTDSVWVAVAGSVPTAWPYVVGVARQDTVRIVTLPSLGDTAAQSTDIRDVVRYPRGRMFGIQSPQAMTANSPVWEPRPNHAVDGRGRIYVSEGVEYRIDVYDCSGRLIRRIRRSHEPIPVTNELFDRYAAVVRTYFDTASAQHREWEIERASQTGRIALPRVPHLPVTGRLMASFHGDLWVERPDLVSDPVRLEWTRDGRPESIWDVFRSTGEFLGTVQLPERFEPRVITGPAVLGVLRDDLDVEYVARFRLTSWPQ